MFAVHGNAAERPVYSRMSGSDHTAGLQVLGCLPSGDPEREWMRDHRHAPQDRQSSGCDRIFQGIARLQKTKFVHIKRSVGLSPDALPSSVDRFQQPFRFQDVRLVARTSEEPHIPSYSRSARHRSFRGQASSNGGRALAAQTHESIWRPDISGKDQQPAR